MRKVFSHYLIFSLSLHQQKEVEMNKKRKSQHEEYKELLLPEKFDSDQKMVEKFLSPLLYKLKLIKLVCPMTIEKCFPALSSYNEFIGHHLEHKLFKFGMNPQLSEFLKELEDSIDFMDNSFIKLTISAKRTRYDHAYYRLKRLENTISPLFENILKMEGTFNYNIADGELKSVSTNLDSAIFANLCTISEKAFSLNSMLTKLHEEYSRLTRIDCLKLPKDKLDCLWEKAIPFIENPISSKATYYYVFGTKSLPENENPRVILWNGSSTSLCEHIWELFEGKSCKWKQLKYCNIFRIKKKDQYVIPAYETYRCSPKKKNLP